MTYLVKCRIITEGPPVTADTQKEAKDLAFSVARDHGDIVDVDFDVTEVEEGASSKV